MRIEVPRDCEGSFEPQIIGKHERRECIADHPIIEIDLLLPWNVVAQLPTLRLAA